MRQPAIVDTYKAFERLTAAGFAKEKAEAILESLGETGDSLATKADLRDLEQRVTIRLSGLVAAGVVILAVLEVSTQWRSGGLAMPATRGELLAV